MSKLVKISALISLFYLTACHGPQVQESDKNTHEHMHQHEGDHVHTPHMGIVAPILSNKIQQGFTELKLHDDKGDLELWLTQDEAGTQAFDLPLGTVITVSFPGSDFKTVELRIRNKARNEDEMGMDNIRKNKTNYFIFPGDTGADASFLVGADFVANAVVSFTIEGSTYSTAPFKLQPHTH